MKYICVILFSFLLTQNLLSNWELLTLPSGSGTARDVFCYNSFVFAKASDGKIYRSNNNGSTWIDISNGLPTITSDIRFIVNWNNLFISLYNKGIYRTSNNGNNWVSCSNGLNGVWLLDMSCNSSYLLINTEDTMTSYFAYTSDVGSTWTVQINSAVNSGFLCESNFFGWTSNSLYISSNWGSNWISKYTFNSSVDLSYMFYEPSLNSSLYIAGSSNFKHLLFRSTDYGTSWFDIASGLPPDSFSYISCVKSKNGVLLVGQDLGLFITSNQGSNWVNKTDNLGGYPYILEMAVNDSYVYVRIAGSNLYRRVLNEVIGLKQISTELPNNFELYQNYPNPFNPSTTIKFDILSKGNVWITIYDVVGNEVSTLLNQELKPGKYKVDWDGSNFSSGVYFYRLETKEFLQTKKMILIR